MTRLLVTGLALGREFGTCQACNFDLSWLIRYPSTLLWADRIMLTPEMFKNVTSGHFAASPPLAKSVQLLFDICRTENIFENYDPTPFITPEVSDGIYDQIERDRNDLLRIFPDRVSLGDDGEVPGEIFVDGMEYCTPHLWTIYASLFLAQVMKADCLFGDTVLNYCRHKFGLAGPANTADPNLLAAFGNVFDAYLPNPPVFPRYALEDASKCSSCARENDCSGTYLNSFEENVKLLIKWRDYDEIHQLREVISRIVERKREQGLLVVPSDISREFAEHQSVLRKRLQRVFPKVERWANVTTIVSLPVAIAGIATGGVALAAGGATVAGLSTATKEMLKYLRSKYSWVGFTSKDAVVKPLETKPH